MLFKTLLVTLLAAAPLGAWAFGDLDCIGIEISTCEGADCAPFWLNFPITFDWTTETLSFPYDDTIVVLEALDEEIAQADTTGQLVYGDAAGSAMLLDFDGPEVTVIYSVGAADPAPIHRALCAPQEAA